MFNITLNLTLQRNLLTCDYRELTKKNLCDQSQTFYSVFSDRTYPVRGGDVQQYEIIIRGISSKLARNSSANNTTGPDDNNRTASKSTSFFLAKRNWQQTGDTHTHTHTDRELQVITDLRDLRAYTLRPLRLLCVRLYYLILRVSRRPEREHDGREWG